MPLDNTAPNGADAGSTSPADATADQPAPTMEDTARAAYKEMQARGAFDENDTEALGEQSVDSTPRDGRARGPDGKFLPKDTNAAQDSTVQPDAAAEAAKAAQTGNTNPDNLTHVGHDGKTYPIDITKAPSGWRGDAKTPFETLPETARREIHKREFDFHRGLSQYREGASFGAQIAQELLPYQETINQSGLHPREIVKSLGAAWNTLVTGTQEQKAALLLQIAKDYSINIASSDPDAQQQASPPIQDDPRLAAALQRIDKLEGHLTAQERQRAAAAETATHHLIQTFGSDPKNKHFAQVEDQMTRLLMGKLGLEDAAWNALSESERLQRAYNDAIWMHPEVRASLLAEQEKERATKAAEQAAAARKAAGANVQRRGTPPVTAGTGSIEDTLRAGLRRINAG